MGTCDDRLALSLNKLAELYREQEKHSEAEPLYQRALAIWEKALRPEDASAAAGLNNLGLLYDAQGRYAAAEPLFRRSLVIVKKAPRGLSTPTLPPATTARRPCRRRKGRTRRLSGPASRRLRSSRSSWAPTAPALSAPRRTRLIRRSPAASANGPWRTFEKRVRASWWRLGYTQATRPLMSGWLDPTRLTPGHGLGR